MRQQRRHGDNESARQCGHGDIYVRVAEPGEGVRLRDEIDELGPGASGHTGNRLRVHRSHAVAGIRSHLSRFVTVRRIDGHLLYQRRYGDVHSMPVVVVVVVIVQLTPDFSFRCKILCVR